MSNILEHKAAIWVLLGLMVLTHLPFMNEPPRSIHVWRQCITLSMARNLAEEGMNILEPRVDRRMDTDGITGSQFLSYEYLLACLFNLFGTNENFSRWLSLLFYGLIAGGMFAWLRQLNMSRTIALCGAWLMSFSPELYYHGINALPDILALACSVWGLYFFFKWHQSSIHTRWLLAALVCITLGGLTKLQYLATGVPMAVVFIQGLMQRRYDRATIVMALYTGILGIAVCIAWYGYAHLLIQESGLKDIGIVFQPETDWRRGLAIITRNIISDLPELLLGYVGILGFVMGLWMVYRRKLIHHPLFYPFLIWAMVLLGYHLIELRQMGVHQYYMLPYFPLLFLIAATGMRIIDNARKVMLFLLLPLSTLLAVNRIVPARWVDGQEGILRSYYQAETRNKLETLVADTTRIITGPDASGCINFYFLHKKGFSYEQPGQAFEPAWNGRSQIDDAIERGARVAYITSPEEFLDIRWAPYVKRELFRNDEVWVFELASPANLP